MREGRATLLEGWGPNPDLSDVWIGLQVRNSLLSYYPFQTHHSSQISSEQTFGSVWHFATAQSLFFPFISICSQPLVSLTCEKVGHDRYLDLRVATSHHGSCDRSLRATVFVCDCPPPRSSHRGSMVHVGEVPVWQQGWWQEVVVGDGTVTEGELRERPLLLPPARIVAKPSWIALIPAIIVM